MAKPKFKTLRNKLTKLSREYVLKRDRVCVKCGKKTALQLSHVVPKSRSKLLRWDENNLKMLCGGCHLKWHNEVAEYGTWFTNKYPGRWAYLQEKKNIIMREYRSERGITEREWLQKQIDYYKERLNE